LSSTDIQVDDKGIVNIENLAESIKQGLNNSALVDSAYKTGLTHFGSARLSRYMLEGEPKVEFSLGGTK
jgi:GH24 family phage-related lysozyme (muramidase)